MKLQGGTCKPIPKVSKNFISINFYFISINCYFISINYRCKIKHSNLKLYKRKTNRKTLLIKTCLPTIYVLEGKKEGFFFCRTNKRK